MALLHGMHRTVAVADLRVGDHACLFFGSTEEQLSVLGSLVVAGLAARQKLLFLAGGDGPHTPYDLLDRCRIPLPASNTRDDGVAQRIQIMDAEEFCLYAGHVEPRRMVGRLRREADRALTEGYAGLRIVGDMSVAIRDEDALGQLLQYEALLAREFRRGLTLAVCQYDARRFDTAQLKAFASAHPRSVDVEPLVRTAELRVVRTYHPSGLRVEGVVDIRTHRHLRGALGTLERVDGDVQLDLSRLEFLDLGGLRLLMAFAGSRRAGSQVELAGLAPHLREVIALVGWDDTPGLRLGADHVN
ncbi:MEDS domain-containing protein [Streptomyces sp. ISL-98]|uniref:MEDS domain-containing protein n=1 Tax=Streptomyces sp. ISL-98 TaxID=2819192 RepID=UPI001BEB6D37|nr:MEDS domain-containing protein [Streptomyces sp. ISL-98]MBT2509587.1 MEDS domain-containing protein [Streptomyces sp. ISL-98]